MLLKKQDRFLIPTTMWNIIKSAAVRKVKNEDMHLLKNERDTTNNNQVISDAFSNYLFQLLKKLLLKIIVILHITCYKLLIILSQI